MKLTVYTGYIYDLLLFRSGFKQVSIIGLVSCRDPSITSLQATSSARMVEALLQSITDDPVSDALPDAFLDPQRGEAMEHDLFVFGSQPDGREMCLGNEYEYA